MTKQILFISLLSLVILSSSCKRYNFPPINGKGSVTTESRTVSDFTAIDFQTEGTVYVSNGTEFSVSIEAQQNIIDDMKTEVSGSKLKIYNRHILKNHEPIKIYITMPSLERMEVSGSGSAIVQSKFEAGTMDISLSGSGEIEFADSLIASEVNADISGSGDIKLNCWTDSFNGKISGSGSITANGVATHETISKWFRRCSCV